MSDLDYLTIGLVNDMLIERMNDSYEYDDEDVVIEATQADFDKW